MGGRWDGPPLEAWQAWSPQEAQEHLAGVSAPWAVAGGWAIDLWLGVVTRPHEDLEITVPAFGYPEIRARFEVLGFEVFDVGDGEVARLAPGEAPSEANHQTWMMEPATQLWRIDVFREAGDARTWVYRRDPSLTAPRAFTVRERDGVPFVAPAVALLFKAKAQRPKDEADFAAVAPHLPAAERNWLADALRRTHAGHPWIERLAAS